MSSNPDDPPPSTRTTPAHAEPDDVAAPAASSDPVAPVAGARRPALRVAPSIERRLEAWLAAGLLDEEQVAGIRRFESELAEHERQGRPARAIALLGALTLVSGIGSVVAYNWQDIGDALKLGGMGLLLVVAAAAVRWATDRQGGHEHAAGAALDVTLVAYAGLALGGLSLVSQIYDQDGPLWQLLALWSLLIAPTLYRSRTRFATAFWYAGLWITLVATGDRLEDTFRSLHFNGDASGAATLMVLWAAGAGFFARSMTSTVAARAELGKWGLSLHLLFLGVVGSFAWWHGGDAHPLLWAVGAAALGGVLLALPAQVRELGWGDRRHALLLFALGGSVAVLPLGLKVDSGVLSFVSFVLFFGLAWLFAERHGRTGPARLAVTALAIRVVAASFELFESLLVTGLTLIAMGAVALFLTRNRLFPNAEPPAKRVSESGGAS